jgi:exopolysaccharide biosynthesis polyprenyl glycosylphosphotransferase
VLLVGTGPRAVEAVRECTSGRELIIGAVDSELQPQLAASYPEIPFLGSLLDLHEVVQQVVVDEVRVALPMRSCFDDLEQVFADTRQLGLPVSLKVDWLHGLEVTGTAPAESGLLLEINRNRVDQRWGRVCKRSFDVVVASLLLFAASPFLLLVALAVRLTSSGPAFFRQERIGRGLRPFWMYKFRTMVSNAEELRPALQNQNFARGISFKILDDPRITRVGAFLRKSSIDEIPQLLNVLLGDMSLVGPRPIPLFVAEQLEHTNFHRRFVVAPGMTGLWQVEGRTQDFDVMGAKDLEYVDHWSFWLDLKILAKTPFAVLRGEGAI